MSNELVQYDNLEKLGRALVASNYFRGDVDKISQAIVKVMAGQEMGFGPIASMTGIYIIKGHPAISANLMASAVKANPRYDYRVRELSGTMCRIEFFEGGQSIGESSFSAADAQKAGTKNMAAYPRNMLFARAISNGVKWFCPDVFMGNPVYTPEELGEAGTFVDGEFHAVEEAGPGEADVVDASAESPTPERRRPTPPPMRAPAAPPPPPSEDDAIDAITAQDDFGPSNVNTMECVAMGPHATKSGKYRIGFYADGEKYPSVHIWSTPEEAVAHLGVIAPFVTLFYTSDMLKNAPEGKRFAFPCTVTHDGGEYPKALSASFEPRHRTGMAKLMMKWADGLRVEYGQFPDDPEEQNAWFTNLTNAIKEGK